MELVRDEILKAGIKTKGGVSSTKNLFITKMINEKKIWKIQMVPSVEEALDDPVLFHTEICHPNHS